MYLNIRICIYIYTSKCLFIYRGMSTAAAIEYTSLVHNDPNSNIIKFLVLDSPYASVKQVVDTVLSKFHEKVTYNLGDIYMCKYIHGILMCT
jgi:hypothetical protein